MIQSIYIFKPRAFNIVWGNDKRCWRMAKPIGSSTSSKNEKECAELVQVSWLEVTGVTRKLSASTCQITYQLSLEKGASGWTGAPVFLMAKVGKKGKYKWKKLEVEKLTRDPTDFPSEADPFGVEIANDQPDKRLYFGLYEVWSGRWKQGLKVYKAKSRSEPNPGFDFIMFIYIYNEEVGAFLFQLNKG
ncbi:hypothetical protein ES319_D03G138900v1 [Gossypium barbadense]|uniref:Protein PHLOEM PROTEIN 2-LIKE A9-like n=2 Tax=Gossypium TaxID=3633 RepID=A0A5J5S4B5_GOSBA|nr:hypothetical protein ES319_D03G138900v1 [Gossypium barbadense]PPD78972.1 hypothetical protein GOBAR_DD24095 [Gossypium barbadense]TYG76875.1 hypothetical protein ES288_D03G149600v1 [Gossypium darwinii]